MVDEIIYDRHQRPMFFDDPSLRGRGKKRQSRGETDIIYGVVDPRDGKVFYIGKTNNLFDRFKEHINMCGDNERKQARIQEILDAHMLPWMLTLEVVDVNVSAREREIAYIQAYVDAGYELLNDEVLKEGE